MGNSQTLGLDYNKCDIVISKLKSALDEAYNDSEYLRQAACWANGCRSEASEGIESARSKVTESINNMLKFKSQFEKFYNEVKAFDDSFSKDIDGIDKFASDAETFLGYATSGKDGALGALCYAYKSGTSGCSIYKKGDYYIIKGTIGKRDGLELLEKIKSARYKMGSASFNDAGLGKYLPKGSAMLEYLDKTKANVIPNINKAFEGGVGGFINDTYKFNESTIGNIGKGLGYASIGIDVISGIKDNMDNGETKATKYVADATTDTIKDLGGMAAASACAEVGFAIGTAIPVPVVGSVVGAATGFAVGYIGSVAYNEVVDGVKINGKTIAGWASYGIEKGLDGAGDLLKKIF